MKNRKKEREMSYEEARQILIDAGGEEAEILKRTTVKSRQIGLFEKVFGKQKPSLRHERAKP